MKKSPKIGTSIIALLYGVAICIAYPYIKLFISYRWNYKVFLIVAGLFLLITFALQTLFAKSNPGNKLYRLLFSSFVKYILGFIITTIVLYIVPAIKHIPGFYFYYVCPLPFMAWTANTAWIWSGIKLLLLGLFLLWGIVILSQVSAKILNSKSDT